MEKYIQSSRSLLGSTMIIPVCSDLPQFRYSTKNILYVRGNTRIFELKHWTSV